MSPVPTSLSCLFPDDVPFFGWILKWELEGKAQTKEVAAVVRSADEAASHR